VVEFAVGDDDVWSFTITRDSISTRRNDLTPSDLSLLCLSFRHECQARLPTYALGELTDRLLSPLSDILDSCRTLIVVPESRLYGIPFHAMCPGREPLAETHRVLYLPAASFLCRHDGTDAVAAVTAQDPCTILGAPQVGYTSLPDLPGVSPEIAATQAFFDDVRAYLGPDATHERLVELGEETRVLHLACHGWFEAEAPLLSRVFLADRPVYAFELQLLRLDLRLAVLSACHTAESSLTPGGEGQGLASALMGAGSDTVLATWWPMADDAASVFMDRFYDALLKHGRDPWDATRTAQLAVRELSEFDHPLYWAPFVTFGIPSGGEPS
jgi:CHAT domain-containing protein